VGSIPTEIGTLKSLRMLDLKDNEISGDIPDEVGQLENLGESISATFIGWIPAYKHVCAYSSSFLLFRTIFFAEQ